MSADFFIGEKSIETELHAQALGFEKIHFVKRISSLGEIKKGENCDAVLIETESAELLRRMIDRASNFCKIILVLGTNDKINRIVLESRKASALVSPEHWRKYDYMDRRNSGLNQVLCKIARDNGKQIIASFADILRMESRERAILLGRIAQNMELCRKYNVRMKIGNFSTEKGDIRSASELKSFCAALGMSTAQIKNAL